MTGVRISPSLLAADPIRLAEEAASLKEAGCDYFHLDIMDGHFVPNLTYGLPLAQRLKEFDVPLDIHLMVECLDWAIPTFAPLARYLTIHVEATRHLHRMLQCIRELGPGAGVAINPGTGLEFLPYVLDVTDLVLVMAVNPGWGGQKFIGSSVSKVKKVKELLTTHRVSAVIEVDGGVTADNAGDLVRAGADILVSGSYLLGSEDRAQAMQRLRRGTFPTV